LNHIPCFKNGTWSQGILLSYAAFMENWENLMTTTSKL